MTHNQCKLSQEKPVNGAGFVQNWDQWRWSFLFWNYISPITWENQPINRARNNRVYPLTGGAHVYKALIGSPPVLSVVIGWQLLDDIFNPKVETNLMFGKWMLKGYSSALISWNKVGRYCLFQMVIWIPLICISNQCELVKLISGKTCNRWLM